MPIIEPSLQVHQNQYTSKNQPLVRSEEKKFTYKYHFKSPIT
jgi:hypothetical protein